jgi:Fur family zinc uptake transcriptional regulator
VPDVLLQRNMTKMQPASDAHHHDHEHGLCQHAHDHSAHAATGLARAEKVCRERGLRLTPIRRKALEALYSDHKPVGAYDLADRISPPGGRRLAPISIYRALDFLVEQGFVHRLSSRNAFIACPHGHGADEAVAFLICEICGGVDEDASPAMRQAIRGMAEGRHFQTSYQVVEIVGRCEHCRDAAAA